MASLCCVLSLSQLALYWFCGALNNKVISFLDFLLTTATTTIIIMHGCFGLELPQAFTDVCFKSALHTFGTIYCRTI